MLAGAGNRVADQTAGAEAVERRVETPLADLADQLYGGRRAYGPGWAGSSATGGGGIPCTVRSSGRIGRLPSTERLAASSSKLSKAVSKLSPLAGASWRWRASAIAEEMLPVVASASRSVCSSTSS